MEHRDIGQQFSSSMVNRRGSIAGGRPAGATVVIDSFPDSVFRYPDVRAVVCIDVLNTSTTLVTAAARNQPARVVGTRAEAFRASEMLDDSLLVGEEERTRLEGFHLPDSPAALDRHDSRAPLVVFSPQGSELIMNADAQGVATYVCCLRNLTATAHAVAESHRRIAIVGAGYHNEFSCEDQMACARFASLLLEAGFAAEDLRTSELVRRWGRAELDLIALGNTAASLRRRGREDDVDFVLAHRDDTPLVVRSEQGRITATSLGFTLPPMGVAEGSPRAEATIERNV